MSLDTYARVVQERGVTMAGFRSDVKEKWLVFNTPYVWLQVGNGQVLITPEH